MSFKACLLDLDHTIYDYEIAHKAALSASIELLARVTQKDLAVLQKAYEAARHSIHEELAGQAASHSRILYFQRICEAANIKPLSTALQAESAYWDCFLENMHIREGAIEFLEYLERQSIPVAIVSDLTAQIQLRKMAKLGIEDLITKFVSSEEAGQEKPSEHMFRLALRKLEVEADDVFMVGDSFERDIKGALNLGIFSFWLTANEIKSRTLIKTLSKNESNRLTVFSSFAQLIDSLEKITSSARSPF